MTDSLPAPSPDYVSKQERLVALYTAGRDLTAAELKEKTRLETSLKTDFVLAWELEPERMKTTSRLLSRFGSSRLDPDHIFDHCDCYQGDGSFVIVAQPYAMPASYFHDWVKGVGFGKCSVANEWGYYYPKSAKLAIFEFTPRERAKLMKKISDVHWHPFPLLKAAA